MESRVYGPIGSIGDHLFFTAKKFNTHVQRRLIATVEALAIQGVTPRQPRRQRCIVRGWRQDSVGMLWCAEKSKTQDCHFGVSGVVRR